MNACVFIFQIPVAPVYPQCCQHMCPAVTNLTAEVSRVSIYISYYSSMDTVCSTFFQASLHIFCCQRIPVLFCVPCLQVVTSCSLMVFDWISSPYCEHTTEALKGDVKMCRGRAVAEQAQRYIAKPFGVVALGVLPFSASKSPRRSSGVFIQS